MKGILCSLVLLAISLQGRTAAHKKGYLQQQPVQSSDWQQNQLKLSEDLIKRIDDDISIKNQSYHQTLQITQLANDIDQFFTNYTQQADQQTQYQDKQQQHQLGSDQQPNHIIQDQDDISLQFDNMFHNSKVDTQPNKSIRFRQMFVKTQNQFETLNKQNQVLSKQADQIIRFRQKSDKKKKHLKKHKKQKKQKKQNKNKKDKKKNNKHERILNEIKSNLQKTGRKVFPFQVMDFKKMKN